uniref:Uncharacterized protein n=1 Tax=Panagrolaimus sp. JU765 TaxID=591449 RepID=A0AC34RD47_9BILA
MAKVLVVVFLAIVLAVGFGIQTQKAFVGVRITNQQAISTAENGTRLVFGLTPESSTKIDAFYGITTEAFRGQGFESLNRDFHPQITIAALQPSESPVLKSKMRRLVNSEFYFGKQLVQRLDLCSEVIDKETGYFGILAEAEFPL